MHSPAVSLPANTGPQDRTAQQSLFLASPDPTGLEVHQQSHYLMRFTGGSPSRTFLPGTIPLPTIRLLCLLASL
jgi:hypothetical protein